MTQYSVAPMPAMRRTRRFPSHTFQLRTMPFGIYPFMIAPVLPGETMKSLNFQCRTVTDPIKNALVGWWAEYYFFYVKLSDLYDREEFRNLLLNPSATTTAIESSQGGTGLQIGYYYSGGAGMINYTRLCARVIVDHYFRDEDETYNDHTINDTVTNPISVAQYVGNSWLDSAKLEDTVTSADVPVVDLPGDANTTLDASEVQAALTQWQMMKLYNLTEMSYEEYLQAQGIATPGVPVHRPELIRYVREWQYPTNTIDPTNGTPRSAVSWSLRERADKPRFFPEPGFIVGMTCVRPKVYFSNVTGTASSLFNDYKAWAPSFLHQMDPNITRKRLAETVGPLSSIVADVEGYWVDLKDVLLYGEQFFNFQLNSTVANLVPGPDAGLTSNKRYPVLADCQSFFVGAAGTAWVRHDGVTNLDIASSAQNPIRDTTPRGGVRSDQTSGGSF